MIDQQVGSISCPPLGAVGRRERGRFVYRELWQVGGRRTVLRLCRGSWPAGQHQWLQHKDIHSLGERSCRAIEVRDAPKITIGLQRRILPLTLAQPLDLVARFYNFLPHHPSPSASDGALRQARTVESVARSCCYQEPSYHATGSRLRRAR